MSVNRTAAFDHGQLEQHRRTLSRFNQNVAHGANSQAASTKFSNHRPMFNGQRGVLENGGAGKTSPDFTCNTEKIYRRQKQNHSLLIPQERISKLTNFSQNGAHRVSLRSIASPQELSVDIQEAPSAPRAGKSMGPIMRQSKHVRGPGSGSGSGTKAPIAADESNKIAVNINAATAVAQQNAEDFQQLFFEEFSGTNTPKEIVLPARSISLNNSLGLEEFKNNIVTSPSRDIMSLRKAIEITSPETDKLKYLQAINKQQFTQNSFENIKNLQGNPSFQKYQLPTSRTDDQGYVTNFDSQHFYGPASGSFRVENRRARPKIVQNVNDQGNAFFSKQASILNTTTKRHRRGVSSPGTEFLFLNKNEQILNKSAIVKSEHKQQPQAQAGNTKAQNAPERDQFNFTFFKERTDPKQPYISLNSDAHINVGNLLNSAHAQKRNGEPLIGLNAHQNNINQQNGGDHGLISQTLAANTANFSTQDYQNFLHQQLATPATAQDIDDEELKTPGLKPSNGYQHFLANGSSSKQNYRSNSTGLKPATAVRLKSLPWNFQPISYEVATTATSHSRRTAENVPFHNQFHHNFQSLEGMKPSTSSATAKTGINHQYATLEELAQQSNQTRSKEDDVFSNRTVSNTAASAVLQQTPTSTSKGRQIVSPLFIQQPGTGRVAGASGRLTAQKISSVADTSKVLFIQKQDQKVQMAQQSQSHEHPPNSLIQRVSKRLTGDQSAGSNANGQQQRLMQHQYDYIRSYTEDRLHNTPQSQQQQEQPQFFFQRKNITQDIHSMQQRLTGHQPLIMGGAPQTRTSREVEQLMSPQQVPSRLLAKLKERTRVNGQSRMIHEEL